MYLYNQFQFVLNMSTMAALPEDLKASVDDEEDDYMSMTIVEPTKPKEKETYTQRRIRKQREVILRQANQNPTI